LPEISTLQVPGFQGGGHLSACATSVRVVYPGSGTTKVVRLRETIKGAKIWYKDSTGVTIPGVADLPEGGYFMGDLNQ